MITSKPLFLLPILALFILFPFFEGGETSSGLFVFHTITLVALAATALAYSRLWIPRFVVFFFPFLLVLIISTIISDYKYAAFLKLWDYFLGGVWTILICTLLRENKRESESIFTWIFLVGSLSTIAAILLYNKVGTGRISASFLNPNEYASFALMLFCLGFYCLEQETNHQRKRLIAGLSCLLLLSVGFSLSRGVFIASLSIAALAFFRRKPGKTIKILLILLILVSGSLVTFRLKYYEDPLKYYRGKIWKSSLKGISEDPELGIGLGMLEYRARTFNFPADTELGRYGRIARSADSQYVQILAETGFLGLLTFLFGWFGLFSSLRKTSSRYFYLKLAWLVVSIASLFSVLLQNTSVLFLLSFLVSVPISESNKETLELSFHRPGRILIPLGCFLLFVLGCYLPFQSDREFYRALRSKDLQEADKHLSAAIRYNPYQPYFRFVFIRKIVDRKPELDTHRWLTIVSTIDRSIALNPLEYEFYVYKARIFRILLEKNINLRYYSSAVSAYQTALDYNPYNVFLRLEFASFLYKLKRYNLAEREVRTTLEAEPSFLNARIFLTEILLTTNKPEDAKKEYAAFLDYHKRFGGIVDSPPSPYIRSLLQVNAIHKQKVEELLKAY